MAVLAATTLAQSPPSSPPFIDATTASGLDFIHVNGATGRLLLPEVIGGGGALFDYDNDGDLDLFVVQSGTLPPAPPSAGSRLYRNEYRPGMPVRFTDVTARSGLAFAAYGMGAAAGDVDNDGFVDLLVTALGATRLFRNKGDGTFTDVTRAAGVDDPRWSTSAAFVDVDRDGWLDVFVANYVSFRAETAPPCYSAASARDYCNPAAYAPSTSRLLHNRRDGTFTDVSMRAGLTRAPARGLGVLAIDANEDGWMDVYVANDGDPNQLWLNEGGVKDRRSGVPADAVMFEDGALLAGSALNRAGDPQGSMGIDSADVDRDGDEDLFITNLDNEGNTLYWNQGKGLFEDRTVESGLYLLGFTGFGARLLDYDLDGWTDLVVANGAVRHLASQVRRGDPYPLRQQNHLFRNDGRGRFTNMTARAGDAFAPLGVGRGIAAGDIDNDGDLDLVIFHNNGPARLLLNTGHVGRHWIGLRILDTRGRDALGARVAVGGQTRRVQTDGSYLSAGDPRVLFGLGGAASPQRVRVTWPDGKTEEFPGLAVDRYWVIEPGRAPREP